MVKSYEQSDKVIIVLHEIYGINNHILEVCKTISKYGMESMAPNLLNGKEPFNYDQEAIAYNYFMENVGFERAFCQVKEVLRNAREKYKKVYVLGYSVGATLAWLCSETGLCDLAIGFYGSRIRDYLDITPACPVLLLFPTEEKAFNVDDLISRLSNYNKNIQVKKISGQHGFSNPFSKSYNKRSSIQACKQIIFFCKSAKCN